MASESSNAVLGRIADEMLAARFSANRLDGQRIGDTVADLDTAYAVQVLIGERARRTALGDVAGYKIGMSSAAIQAQFGLSEPILGRVFRSQVFGTGAVIQAQRSQRIGVECEIATTLAVDLGPDGIPYDKDSIAGHVATVHAAIEIIEDRFRDSAGTVVSALAADNMLSLGGVIAADPARPQELSGRDGWIEIDGVIRMQGTSSALFDGGPLGCLAWLANQLAGSEYHLRAGQVVFSGGITAPLWIEPPHDRDRSTVAGEVSGLGRTEFVLHWS